MSKPFNPTDGIIKVQGNREYLPVNHRILWFHREFPEWGIETEAVTIDHQRNFAVFRCTIRDENGRIRSQATKMEDQKGFGDFLEKAETGSVGRALAFLGYGVLGAKDFEEGERYADAPQPVRTEKSPRAVLLEQFTRRVSELGQSELIETKGRIDKDKVLEMVATIMAWLARGYPAEFLPPTEDNIIDATSHLPDWITDQTAPITAAQNDYPPPLPDPETDPDPPFEGGVLFPAPAPTETVQGGYADQEAEANRAGKPDPQGRKSARQ